jgi:hypothetical protein
MQSEKELNRLKNENEQMRLELEALKQAKQTCVQIIDDSDEENDLPPEPKLKIEKKSKPPPPKPAKSILSIIDDSDDEGEEEEDKTVSTKSHKIMKAMECDFID